MIINRINSAQNYFNAKNKVIFLLVKLWTKLVTREVATGSSR